MELLERHRASMAALAGEGAQVVDGGVEFADWSLASALDALGPIHLGDATVEFGLLEWSPASWRGPSDRREWHRRVRLAVSVDGVEGHIDLDVPWCFDARSSSAADQAAAERVGGHRGFYLGRPLVPVARIAPLPGIHVVRRPNSPKQRAALVVPDIGPMARLRLGRVDGSAVEVQVAGFRRRRIDPIQSATDVPLDRLVARGHPPLGVFGPKTRDEIQAAWGEPLLDMSLPQLTSWLAAVDDAEVWSASDEVAATRTRLIGHELLDAVVSGLVAGLQRWASVRLAGSNSHSVDSLALAVRSRCQGHFERLWRGDERYGASLVADDDRNTLAWVEKRNMATRYGFFVPKAQPGHIWLRDIALSHRFEWCPLQTPESADLGFVRFASLGVASQPATDSSAEGSGWPGDWADLSVAASMVPFVNHNDPVRSSIGAKNLKQAVPIEGRSLPRVYTGAEAALAEAAGVLRCPQRGQVSALYEDHLVLTPARGEPVVVGFGPGVPTPIKVESKWTPTVEVGERVRPGQILARAPDVVLASAARAEDDAGPGSDAAVALGTDVLVAYTPWFGWNYEDAVVASSALVDRFASRHRTVITESLARNVETVSVAVAIGDEIEEGQLLGVVYRLGRDEPVRSVTARFNAVFTGFRETETRASFEFAIRRPLAVGDKITNRHGAKGVISQIIPEEEMPRLPDGTPVEMIMNPVGVIRRNNVGQLIETHVTLRDYLDGSGPTRASRRLDDLDALAADLDRLGARGGRMRLVMPGGSALPDPTPGASGVVVGWQYVVKLDHLAADKVRVRARGAVSVRDAQPAQGTRYADGKKVAGAQRAGEMEMWCLLASNADRVVADILEQRSGSVSDPSPTLAAIEAVLAAAGLMVDAAAGVAVLAPVSASQLLPDEAIHEIISPRRFGTVVSADKHPLYRSEYFGAHGAPLCRCGQTDVPGSRCEYCGTVPRARGAARSRIPRHIELPFPVAHPWFDPPGEFGPPPAPWVAFGHEHPGGPALRLVTWGPGGTDSVPGAGITTAAIANDAQSQLVVAEVDGAGVVQRAWQPPLCMDSLIGYGWHGGSPFVVGGDAQCPRAAGLRPMLTVLPILNPNFRRAGADPLNRRYQRLVTLIAAERGRPDRDALVAAVRDIVGGKRDAPERQTLAARLAHKTGLARRGLRGRNNDWAGRSVIVPDLSVKPWEVRLPAELFGRLGLGDDTESPVVVVNRQPSLLPQSLTALVALPGDSDAIGLHPILTKWFAGDFDGDEVTVHRPAAVGARRQAWELLSPTVRRRNVGTGSPIAQYDLDLALGQVLAEVSVPEVGDVIDRLDGEAALDELARCSSELFDAAVGWSFSLVELAGVKTLSAVLPDSALGQAVRAGVAGSGQAIGQLLEERGALRVFSGEFHDPLGGTFLAGLSDVEVFVTASGALATLADKKIVTPRAGNLTKRLADAMIELRIVEIDCGAAEGVERGPLTCRSERGCCSLCYGPSPATGAAMALGANVGLVAALVIGERCTQRAMKAFQQGGTNVAVSDHVRQLEQLFGQGGGQGSPFAERLSTGGDASVLRPLVEVVRTVLDAPIAQCHIELVLRRCYEVADRCGTGHVLTAAAGSGDPLVRLSTRGQIAMLVDAGSVGDTWEVEEPNKRRLVFGEVVET